MGALPLQTRPRAGAVAANLAQEAPQSSIKQDPAKKGVALEDDASEAAIEDGVNKKSPSRVAKPSDDREEAVEPATLRRSPQTKILEDAVKNKVLGTKLPKSSPIPMAKPDIPSILPLRPHSVFSTSQDFYLPEKPPEGVSPLAKEIHEHLKKRPPVHEPDEVIAEDLSIKDPKEM